MFLIGCMLFLDENMKPVRTFKNNILEFVENKDLFEGELFKKY
jgi:hypothetical protein